MCKICNPQDNGEEQQPEESICTCTTLCIEGAVNIGCPVCCAEGADGTACTGGQEPGEQVQAWIDALPMADELAAMPLEEQQAVWDAYDALDDGQKAEVTGAEAFDSLFAVFNAMVNTLQEPEMPPVTYLIYTWVDGERKKESEIARMYTKITPNIDTDWESGTYVTPLGDVVIYDRVTVSGDVKLILMDGCNLTCLQGIDVSASDGVTNTLSIYAQSENENIGKLLATGGDVNAGIGGSDAGGGAITIHGGNITATGGAKSAGIGGGAITIYGRTVEAAGGSSWGAGIGGSGGDNITPDGGKITITGGTVTAHGSAIGGGNNGNGGTIAITGGTITATGGKWSVGIGDGFGYEGSDGSFSTGDNGKDVIVATGGSNATSDISGRDSWRGVIVENSTGRVYGTSITPAENFDIPTGTILTIENSETLTIQNGVTLTNNGTIIINNGGTLVNEGTIDSTTGTIFDHGTIGGNGTVTGNVMDTASSVTVSVNRGGSPVETVTYGDSITITATAAKASTAGNSLLRTRAAVGFVNFYLGTVDNTLLGERRRHGEEWHPHCHSAG